jgi:GTP-binding protein
LKIVTAEFITSVVELRKCPEPDRPEYAFAGRSNVGKSSLLNMLTNHTGLAKISGRPGKTQTINHFVINKPRVGVGESWYMVDLPGYGFAKVNLATKAKWERFIHNYILKRESLLCVFVLIDSRLEPQQNDLYFMEFLATKEIPFVMVFTKCEKLSATKLNNALKKYKDKLLEEWEELPQMFFTSAYDKKGKEELLAFVDETNKTFVAQPSSLNEEHI